MEIAFYILIILLLGANLYFSLKKDDEKQFGALRFDGSADTDYLVYQSEERNRV